MENVTNNQLPAPVVHRYSWIKILFTGSVYYVLLLTALLLTGNSNLFPALLMVGTFMVPVAYVAFFYERRHLSRLTFSTLSLAFMYGGLLAILAASLLEPIFIRRLDLGAIIKIGLIEEFAKILGVLVIARHRRHDSEIDGLILGAAVGMGFSALESSGYAFTTYLQSNGNISIMVIVTLIRSLLSPLGHGTWTAILASVMFRESRNGHFRINLQVIGAFLLVSGLHALWDGLLIGYSVNPNFFTLKDVLLTSGVISIVGLASLWLRWREGIKLQTILPPETADI